MIIKDFLATYAQLGVEGKTVSSLRKRVFLMNRLSLTVCCAALVFSFLYRFYQVHFIANLLTVISGLFLSLPLLNYYGKYSTSRLLFVTIFNGVAFFNSSALGIKTGIVDVYFALAIVPLVVFTLSEKRSLIYGISLPLFLRFILLSGYHPYWIAGIDIPVELMHKIPFFVTSVTFLIILLSCFYFIRETEREAKKVMKRSFEISELKAEQDAILNFLFEGIVGFSGEGVIVFANAKAEELLGVKLKGKKIRDVIPEGQKGFFEKIEKRQEVYEENDVLLLKEGKLPVSYSIQSKENLTVFTFRDCSKQRNLQRQLLEERERSFHSEKLASLGKMTAGIAHEIKNPLNFIYNFSELIERVLEEMEVDIVDLEIEDEHLQKRIFDKVDSIKKMSNSIFRNGERANKIVENMLDQSRKNTDEVKGHDLNLMIKNTTEFLIEGLRSRIEGKKTDLKFSLDLEEALPDVMFSVQSLSRVLLNLLDNSYFSTSEKYLSLGDRYEPQVRIQTRSCGENVCLVVEDNGVGIDKEVAKNIFDPFFTTKDAGHGTGLGLSMVKECIEKVHGGSIKLESERGNYARFIIMLPFAE